MTSTDTTATARTYFPSVVVSIDPDGKVSGADFSDALASISDFPTDYPEATVEADKQAIAAATLTGPVNADHETVGAVALLTVHPDGRVELDGFDLS